MELMLQQLVKPRYSLWAWRHGYVQVNLVIIGFINGLVFVQYQAIAWNNDKLLTIGPLKINFCET